MEIYFTMDDVESDPSTKTEDVSWLGKSVVPKSRGAIPVALSGNGDSMSVGLPLFPSISTQKVR